MKNNGTINSPNFVVIYGHSEFQRHSVLKSSTNSSTGSRLRKYSKYSSRVSSVSFRTDFISSTKVLPSHFTRPSVTSDDHLREPKREHRRTHKSVVLLIEGSQSLGFLTFYLQCYVKYWIGVLSTC